MKWRTPRGSALCFFDTLYGLMQSVNQSALRLLRVYYFASIAISMIAMFGLAIAFVNKLLTPRELGAAMLVLMMGLFVFFYFLFRRTRFALRDPRSERNDGRLVMGPAEKERVVRLIRRLKVAVVFLVFCLIVGLWQGRYGPIWPVVVGCLVNLSWTTAALLAIKRLQKNLE